MNNQLLKPSLAPFWITLVVGLLAMWLACGNRLLPGNLTKDPGYRFALIFMAVMILVEAFLLWRMRYKVRYRGVTRAYVLILAFAYILPFLRDTILAWKNTYLLQWDRNTMMTFFFAYFIFFPAAFLASQVLFLVLLVTTRSASRSRISSDSPNLLDDFAS